VARREGRVLFPSPPIRLRSNQKGNARSEWDSLISRFETKSIIEWPVSVMNFDHVYLFYVS
jgi:hypothetical protein